jgi:hypothetical protein
MPTVLNTDAQLSGKTLQTVESLQARGHNVLDYGAAGNGTTNDATFIANAITAASSSGGSSVVLFPGKRSYKINSTITVPQGVHLVGQGGQHASNNGEPPAIIWGGAAGGLMFDVPSALGSTTEVKFDNLLITGSGTNDPACAVKFRQTAGTNKVDSGTVFHNCWFRLINGDAIRFENGGSTNFRITGGRFDSIYGGYCVYVSLVTGNNFVAEFDGNITYVGGGGGQGKGFIFLDGEAASGGFGSSQIGIHGLHIEVNQNLTQTYASGARASDKCGLFRLGVTPASGNLQHRLDISSLDVNYGGGLTSFCVFQTTSTSGLAVDAARCSSICMLGGKGLNNFNASDAATTDEVRAFGGNIPDDQRWPFPGYQHGLILWGRGKDSSYEGVRHYVNSDMFKIRGLTVEASTFANRNTQAIAGTKACFTDSNTNTWGATIAGGGSFFVEALYNGTNWTVVGK